MKSVTKSLLLILILALSTTFAGEKELSKVDSLTIALHDSIYASVNMRNEEGLLTVRATYERLLNVSEQPWLINHYIGLTDYNLAIMYFGAEDENKAGKAIDRAIEHLKKSNEQNTFAETHALLSACYGMKVGLAPLKGIIYGPRSGSEMSKAKELDPNNPRVHLIDGIGKMNTPAMFGGGSKKALKSLGIADSLYSIYKPAHPTLPNWGKADPHIWLAQIAMKDKDLTVARKHLEAALKIQPNSNWVNRLLMPKLEEMESLAATGQ